ncbi:hypothetical protein AAEU29_12605 [Pseudoalteromonas sp. SSM20]|uniref:hypothetical protein n=1 Tax=Pseudoalteromonas sp. SSM20 TaxID=3139394 RepID=UPI003BAD4282
MLESVQGSIDSASSQNGGKEYKNKGAFGVDAHKRLENMVNAWEKSNPHLKIGIKVTPETYVSKGGAKGVKAGRFPAGSVSIDIDISYKGETVLGIDLKTGKGRDKKGIENRMSRYRTKNLVQIFFEVK